MNHVVKDDKKYIKKIKHRDNLAYDSKCIIVGVMNNL